MKYKITTHTILLPAAVATVAVFSLAAIFPAVFAQDVDGSLLRLSNNEISTTESSISNETDFRSAMRDLWVDHIVYTRQFIVDSAADLPSLNDTTNRLLKNQEDIGDAIKPYYGEKAGSQLTELLNQHILIAADLVNAAKAGNDSVVACQLYCAGILKVFLSTASFMENSDNWSILQIVRVDNIQKDIVATACQAHITIDPIKQKIIEEKRKSVTGDMVVVNYP